MSDELSEDPLDNAHRVRSSGDNSDIPPPPPSAPNTSTIAVHGSDRAPSTVASFSNIEPQLSSSSATGLNSVTDPSINSDNRHQSRPQAHSSELSANSTLGTDHPATISDPNTHTTPSSSTATSTLLASAPSSHFSTSNNPSLPDFIDPTSLTVNLSSNSLTSNPTDPIPPAQRAIQVPSSSSATHPADPEIKEEDLVDPIVLRQIVELGFEESIAILALFKTKGVGGTEAAVNWILEHSNESDFESENGEELDDMGGAQSSLAAVCQPHKMVFVVNMSLKMGNGKMAAQVGHATLGVYRCAQKSEEGQRALDAWRLRGEMKVVVKGESTEQLLDLFKQAKDIGLFVYVVSDAGRTQIPAGSRTVLGVFGPSETVDTVTGNLKLL